MEGEIFKRRPITKGENARVATPPHYSAPKYMRT
jgi:hypothetical protein